MDEIILSGRLNGREHNRLKRLFDMKYRPGELSEEIGINKNQIYRVYIPCSCPHERDNHNRIWINGKEFGFFVNIVLVVIKLMGGIFGHSRALLADGVHSFADFLTDVITSLGIYLGHIPEDECHHYGHKKIETVAEIIMGFILISVGGYLSVGAARSISRRSRCIAGELPIIW